MAKVWMIGAWQGVVPVGTVALNGGYIFHYEHDHTPFEAA